MFISLSLNYKIVRKQFRVSYSFAITIKQEPKAITFESKFIHGQLYVARSRVKIKKGLKVVVSDADGNLSKTATNVVYKEVLHDL